jgi:hypothetical protein
MRRVTVCAAALLVLAACTSGTSAAGKYKARTPALRVLAKSGCPKSLAGYHDVTNMKNAHGATLLPSSRPTGVLLCGYGSEFDGGKFKGSRTFTAAQATSLASVINRIHLGSDTGMHSCPPDVPGVTVFAFTYPNEPDVNLWWYNGGCQSLDNGFRIGSETGNRTFYEGFMGAMQRLHR